MRPRSQKSLRSLFLTIASLAGASTGCSSKGVDRDGFDLDACRSKGLDGITTAVPTDYFEVRSGTGAGDAFTGAGTPSVVIARHGVRCATAKDPAKCEAALANLGSANGWTLVEPDGPSPRRYIAYTRGDEVGVVDSLTALVAFVQPVDTLEDAVLLAREGGHTVECGAATARRVASGFDVITNSGHNCGAEAHRDEHIVRVTTKGEVATISTEIVEEGMPNCSVGRRPEGFVRAPRAANASMLGRYFASIAELEGASIAAFTRLATELAAHGAPTQMIDCARRAARDEARHESQMGALAQKFGAAAATPEVTELGVRSAFEVALENSVEGCVRETFGALEATYQAQHASDPTVRKVMKGVAKDETRHAALAWEVAAWLEPRLSAEERAQVEAARSRAFDALHDDLVHPRHRSLMTDAGAPSSAVARGMLTALRAELAA